MNSGRVSKFSIENRNMDSLPTYFQIHNGKNTLEEFSKVFTGRDSDMKGGKKQIIPVESCIIARSDSGQRLGLGESGRRDSEPSPVQLFLRKLMHEKERNSLYEPPKLPQVAADKRKELQSMIIQKCEQDRKELKRFVDSFGSSASKKQHYKLFRNIDRSAIKPVNAMAYSFSSEQQASGQAASILFQS